MRMGEWKGKLPIKESVCVRHGEMLHTHRIRVIGSDDGVGVGVLLDAARVAAVRRMVVQESTRSVPAI